MKRISALFLAMALVLSVLAGCGGPNSLSNSESPDTSGSPSNNESIDNSVAPDSNSNPGITSTADKYPSKPITIIAPANPGGGYDSLARAVASMAGNYLGQVVIVENVAGASYTLGTAQAVNSNPDGYTLVLCTNKQFSTTPLSMEVEYDPLDGVEYFGSMAEVRWAWGVNGGLFDKIGVSDTAEFLDYVKAHPGELTAGSSSISMSLMFNLLASAGYEFSLVSYADAASVAVAIANGEVDTGFTAANTQLALAESGDIRLVMEIPGQPESPIAEGVPAATEDFPEIMEILGSSSYQWYGLFGPKGMPQDVIDTINTFIENITADAGFVSMVKKLDMTPAYHSAKDMEEAITSEYAEVKEYFASAPQG